MPSGDAAADAPEASAQSASTAADAGFAGGTTVSIAVYRSSFPIVDWVTLSPEDKDPTRKPTWAITDPGTQLPTRGTPGEKLELVGPYDASMEPRREGYLFEGWSTDPLAAEGSPLNELRMPEGTPEDGAYTLYAIWTPVEYAVIFDLTKNPDVGEGPVTNESFNLNWWDDDATKRKVLQLEEPGRWQVSGFSMLDGARDSNYDPETGLITLNAPIRSGYRFLGWAEPDGQMVSRENGKGGFGVALSRLPQLDDVPVLVARWASPVGVTAPISITFGDYDKTSVPGNPSLGQLGSEAASDTTQSQQDKAGVAGQAGYATGGQAYFENTSWHDAIKMVALSSERDSAANEVLTTYDSSKALEAEVLGGQDSQSSVYFEGERLLSLYPLSAVPSDAASRREEGIHFRLSDSIGESELGSLFTLPAQGGKRAASFGLNLSTDPVDGTENHGLVLETNDYDRKRIATVSYTFAIASSDAEDQACDHLVPDGFVADGIPASETMFVTQNGVWWGFDKISAAAHHISATNGNSECGRFYDRLMRSVTPSMVADPAANADTNHFFQMVVDGRWVPVQLIGICDDVKADGTKAGMTFMFKNVPFQRNMFDSMVTASIDGWCNGTQTNLLRDYLRGEFLSTSFPATVRSRIVNVAKYQQYNDGKFQSGYYPTNGDGLQGPTWDNVFIPSAMEVYGDWRKTAVGSFNAEYPNYGAAECNPFRDAVHGRDYVPFRYDWFAMGKRIAASNMDNTVRTDASGAAQQWWLRTAMWNYYYDFATVAATGQLGNAIASLPNGAVPCFAF